MFVDSSAIVAMLTDEDDARNLAPRLQLSKNRLTSPMAMLESSVILARVLGMEVHAASEFVQSFIIAMNIRSIAIPPEVGLIAVEAYERFGQKRHAADLNFGECIAYACARHFGVPLLYKREGFSLTDIEGT